MHRVQRTALVAFTGIELAILLMAFAKPAYGYVDPGSGLLAIQVGGSMLAGALFVLRTKIRKLLRMGPPEAKPEADPGPTESGQ